MRAFTVALLVLLAAPGALAAQDSTFGGGSRAHLFVYLAYAAAWILIGAWVVRIGLKVRRLEASTQRGAS